MYPGSKSAPLIHRSHPLSRRRRLGIVLLIWIPFALQKDTVAACQSDNEVRAVPVSRTEVEVRNLKVQLVVLDPGFDQRILVQYGAHLSLESRITNGVREVTPLGRNAPIRQRSEVPAVRAGNRFTFVERRQNRSGPSSGQSAAPSRSLRTV